ncbi:prepilin peptidase [Vreelandella zhanjiangensis]|uniref:prepilin peptidase n=1 Tax=Vreelandella zhanjiangensis TaxID=1121960 RepID=UPI000375E994|nr:prepilin peptidase [Halomonas zhanjiangensis]
MWLLLLWALACAYQDLRQRHIDNRLLYPFLLLAVIWLLVTSQSLVGASLASALAGAGIAIALTIPGHIKGILGGGDVKLMVAIGLSTGGMITLIVIAIAALLLVLWTITVALLPSRGVAMVQRYAPGLGNQKGHFAYAPFIFLALGTLYLLALLLNR